MTIRWTTNLEQWTRGYLILRSETADSALAVQITEDLIPALGGSGAKYEYVDTTAQGDRGYFYWLVVVDMDGSSVGSVPMRQPASGSICRW